MKTIRLTQTIANEEDGTYSASCMELGLGTCAASPHEAERRITKATKLVLRTAHQHGELEALLKQKGIRTYSISRT